MRVLIGLACVVVGLVLACWLAGWVMFIGGVVDIIEQIKSVLPLDTMVVAKGAAKIIFCEVGAIPGGLLAMFGVLLIND